MARPRIEVLSDTKFVGGRLVKVQAEYDEYRQQQTSPCAFCDDIPDSQIVSGVEEKRQLWVMRNIFPYAIFDNLVVTDSLMIVPKRHVVSVGELTDDELTEMAKIIHEFEPKGYSVYARAPQNTTRSVVHQHTHLIKTEGK